MVYCNHSKELTDRPQAGKEIENEKVFLYARSGFQVTREYKTDDEYFEIMDSIDVNAWEIIFDKITR